MESLTEQPRPVTSPVDVLLRSLKVGGLAGKNRTYIRYSSARVNIKRIQTKSCIVPSLRIFNFQNVGIGLEASKLICHSLPSGMIRSLFIHHSMNDL